MRILPLVAISIFLSSVSAEAGPCRFSSKRFSGNPIEQARCLLRTIFPGGIVSTKPADLPKVLEARVGTKINLKRKELDGYLQQKHLSSRELAGDLGDPVSKSQLGTRALYFVIHDTSDELRGRKFPANINERSWFGNNLRRRDISEAHVFINRLGESASDNDYLKVVAATKREVRNEEIEGLFLHHELVQPRISGKGFGYGAIGPSPGFTAAQYERLALLYVIASFRRGVWLIPAFHCTMDEGIPDGHDDPQNFDLAQFGLALENILGSIERGK